MYKITFNIYILLFELVLLSVVFVSCNNENFNDKFKQDAVNQKYISSKSSVNKSKKVETASTLQINKKSLIFFTIDNKEYRKLIKNTGVLTKYEFDIMFRNFRTIAKASKSIISKEGISSRITTIPIIQFKLKTGEQFQFNRVEEDMIIGQIFFDGVSKPIVENGVMKRQELRELIKEFFKIEEVAYFPVDTIRVKTDTIINNSDSINEMRMNKFMNNIK